MSTEGKTEKAIRLAIVRIINDKPNIVEPGTRVSFQSVAKEAGVDRRTIDLYPRLRERIEGEKSSKKRKDVTEKQKELSDVKKKLAEERKKTKEQRLLIQSMASNMATLHLENQQLHATLKANNVAYIGAKRTEKCD